MCCCFFSLRFTVLVLLLSSLFTYYLCYHHHHHHEPVCLAFRLIFFIFVFSSISFLRDRFWIFSLFFYLAFYCFWFTIQYSIPCILSFFYGFNGNCSAVIKETSFLSHLFFLFFYTFVFSLSTMSFTKILCYDLVSLPYGTLSLSLIAVILLRSLLVLITFCLRWVSMQVSTIFSSLSNEGTFEALQHNKLYIQHRKTTQPQWLNSLKNLKSRVHK